MLPDCSNVETEKAESSFIVFLNFLIVNSNEILKIQSNKRPKQIETNFWVSIEVCHLYAYRKSGMRPLVLSTPGLHFLGDCIVNKPVEALALQRRKGLNPLLFMFGNSHLDFIVGFCIVFRLGFSRSFSSHLTTSLCGIV